MKNRFDSSIIKTLQINAKNKQYRANFMPEGKIADNKIYGTSHFITTL